MPPKTNMAEQTFLANSPRFVSEENKKLTRNVANICSVLLVVVTVLSQVLFVDGTELLYSVNFPPTLTSYMFHKTAH